MGSWRIAQGSRRIAQPYGTPAVPSRAACRATSSARPTTVRRSWSAVPSTYRPEEARNLSVDRAVEAGVGFIRHARRFASTRSHCPLCWCANSTPTARRWRDLCKPPTFASSSMKYAADVESCPPPVDAGATSLSDAPAGGLRDILVHTLDAEQGGVRLQPGRPRRRSSIPTTAMSVRWPASGRRMRRRCAPGWRRSARRPQCVRVKGRSPLGEAVDRVVNHGTQHRSEAAMILSHWGQSPGDLDPDLLPARLGRRLTPTLLDAHVAG